MELCGYMTTPQTPKHAGEVHLDQRHVQVSVMDRRGAGASQMLKLKSTLKQKVAEANEIRDFNVFT